LDVEVVHPAKTCVTPGGGDYRAAVSAPRPPVFLTARWEHVLMLSYAVDPRLLARRLPSGVELDEHDGRCFVSMVGFRFRDTRVRGFALPFHRDFDEVNLRFYVRRKVEGTWRRGVTFVKEIVPRRLIAWVARGLYAEPYVYPFRGGTPPGSGSERRSSRTGGPGGQRKAHDDDAAYAAYGRRRKGPERALPARRTCSKHRLNAYPYVALPMRGEVPGAGGGRLAYGWRAGGRWHGMEAHLEGEPAFAAEGSLEHFITDHFWGYTRHAAGTDEYEVEHPRWRLWTPRAPRLDLDVRLLYGGDFVSFLTGPPAHALAAEGSAVSVRRGLRLAAVGA
jgi:uncharacterized protein YqjF (DUF2071 family)